jgi:hypothetical protein
MGRSCSHCRDPSPAVTRAGDPSRPGIADHLPGGCPPAISNQDPTANPPHPGSFVTGDPACSASAAGLRIIPYIVRITAVPRPPMTYRRPGPACRPRRGRTPRRPGPATVIELLAGAGLAAGPDPAPGKRVPASRSAAPPSPIGLTAAALSAGAEGERADSRDARPPGTLTCARCPAVRSVLDARRRRITIRRQSGGGLVHLPPASRTDGRRRSWLLPVPHSLGCAGGGFSFVMVG